MTELSATHFLLLSAALFIIGMVGVLTRRNVLVIFMCIELMLNAVNVSLIGFAWELHQLTGQVLRSSSSPSRRLKQSSGLGS